MPPRATPSGITAPAATIFAGLRVHLGATHLLPEAERQDKPYAWLAFGAGVAMAIGIVLSA